MVKLRKACAYRRLERPYTRKSKYREKSYIRASPHIKIARFVAGNTLGKFSKIVRLLSKDDVQVRHNSIESARQTSTRYLEQNVGASNFLFSVRVYPHHILRENPLASGAGADRMSTGMQKSFGKPIGAAARVHTGKDLFCVECEPQHVEAAKFALNRAKKKLPCRCSFVVEDRYTKK